MGLGSRFDLPDFMPETDVEMTFETPWEGDADFSADSSPEEEVYDDQGAKSRKGGSKKKKSGSGGHKLSLIHI